MVTAGKVWVTSCVISTKSKYSPTAKGNVSPVVWELSRLTHIVVTAAAPGLSHLPVVSWRLSTPPKLGVPGSSREWKITFSLSFALSLTWLTGTIQRGAFSNRISIRSPSVSKQGNTLSFWKIPVWRGSRHLTLRWTWAVVWSTLESSKASKLGFSVTLFVSDSLLSWVERHLALNWLEPSVKERLLRRLSFCSYEYLKAVNTL